MKSSTQLRKITVAGLLIALCIILGQFFEITLIPQVSVVSFKQIPIFLGGLLLGPLYGAIIGLCTDLMNLLLHGNVANFNPLFTVSSILVGLCGSLLYKRALTTVAMVVANGIRAFLIGLVWQTFAIYIMFGTAFTAYTLLIRFGTALVFQFIVCSIILVLMIPMLKQWRTRINGFDPSMKKDKLS